MTRVLLLSGGLDSTCIAAWLRPEYCLCVDYGQRAAAAERRAADAVTRQLNLPIAHITVDASAVGGGLMADGQAAGGPTPEWWPYRNQLLITLAAAWGISRGVDEVMLGTVADDGDRHADGTQGFLDAIAALLRLQEGNLTVSAPSRHLSTEQLLLHSPVDDTTLGWTHSCHQGDIPCGHCPGCLRRDAALAAAGRLR